MNSLKQVFYIVLSMSLSFGCLSLCPAKCGAEMQKCHTEIKENLPSCHLPPQSTPDPAQHSKKCQCRHSVQPAAVTLNPVQISSIEQNPDLDSNLPVVEVFESDHSGWIQNHIQVLGPPGHILDSLLTFLSHTEHSPPLFV